MNAPADLRQRKERIAALIYEKRKRANRIAMEDSLYEFTREAWSSIESSTFQDSWAIEALCEHLQAVTYGHIKRLLINFPPRCGKSSVASICWPAWVWAQPEERRSFVCGPGTQFLTASYNHALSLKLSTASRRLILSPFYQEYWGDRFKLAGDQNSKTQYDTDQGGTRISTSIGGSLIGIGGAVLLADDPHNTESVESEAERETVLRWWKEFSSTRLNDPNESAIVVVMQRLNEADVSGVILESARDWTHLMLPMRYDETRHCRTVIAPGEFWEDPRKDTGESLMWPERFGAQKVKEMEDDLGPYMASGRLQQRPSPQGGGILKREWWKTWEEPDYPYCYYKWASADTAYTEAEENDPTGFTVWGLFEIAHQPHIILMDAWRKRLELHIPQKWEDKDGTPASRLEQVKSWQRAAWAQYKAMQQAQQGMKPPQISPELEPWSTYIHYGISNADRWPDETYEMWRLRTQEKWGLCEWITHSCRRFNVNELLIEAKATGITVAQELRRLNGNDGWGIQLKTPQGDKVARAYAVQSTLSSGLVYAPDKAWADLVLEETSSFPKHRYKDLTDSCFSGDTGIFTTNGVVPIADIRVGDVVMTHKGRWRPVLAVGQRQTSEYFLLKSKGLTEVRVTAEHPMLTMHVGFDQFCRGTTRKRNKGLRWEAVGNLSPRPTKILHRNGRNVTTVRDIAHDSLVLPRGDLNEPHVRQLDLATFAAAGATVTSNEIITERECSHKINADVAAAVLKTIVADQSASSLSVAKTFGLAVPTVIKIRSGGYAPNRTDSVPRFVTLDYEAGWCFGLFAAEGCVSQKKATWACDRAATERVRAWANSAFNRNGMAAESVHAWTYTLSATSVVGLFESFGRYAKNKIVPRWMFDAPIECVRGFVDGFAHGDGHRLARKPTHVALTSNSLSLLMGIRLLLAKLGWAAWNGTTKAGGERVVFGGISICDPSYRIDYTEDNTGFACISDEYIGTHIEKCERVEAELTVFNLSVEEDESYVTVGGCAHNCTQAWLHVREMGMLTRPEERLLAEQMAAQYRPQTAPLYPGSR